MVLALGMVLLLLLWMFDLWRRTAQVARKVEGGVLRDRDGGVVGVCLVQPCPSDLEFIIRRQTGYDTMATELGIAREPRLGVRELDQDLYLQTNDPGVVRRLGEEAGLQQVLRRLFARPRADAWRMLQVECASGQLRARASCRSVAAASRATALLSADLGMLADALQGAARGSDPLPARARALLSLPGACAVLAFTGWAFRGLLAYRLLEPGSLLLATLPWSLSATALYLWLCVVALRRGANTHLVLLEGGLLALVGFVGIAYWGAYFANRELDDAGARTLSFVESEYEWRWQGGCRHGWCATLSFPDWRPGHEGEHHLILLESHESGPAFSNYGSIPRNPVVDVAVRPGLLGFPWVERAGRREHDPLRDGPLPQGGDRD